MLQPKLDWHSRKGFQINYISVLEELEGAKGLVGHMLMKESVKLAISE